MSERKELLKRLERLGGKKYYIEDLSEVEKEIYGERQESTNAKKEREEYAKKGSCEN